LTLISQFLSFNFIKLAINCIPTFDESLKVKWWWCCRI